MPPFSRLVPLLLACACSEYGLAGLGKATHPVDTGAPLALDPEDSAPTSDTAAPQDTATPATELPGRDSEAEATAPCDQVPLSWSWQASPAFAGAGDPVDGGGLPFYDPDASPSGWVALSLPDTTIPVHQDRAYRAWVELPALPAGLTLELQSDDGLWLWVNGAAVGHWGGDWQEEGCVNEDANCLARVDVAPVDITPWLVEGQNLIAARVSNPVMHSWFELKPSCVEQ